MSDFPRGWTLTVDSAAGAATITVPAVAGVVHVLDSFTAKITTGAAAGGALVTLSSSDGVFTSVPLGAINSPASSSDMASASGLDLAAGPGASLTIACNAGPPAGGAEFLMIQGHDI